MLGAPSGLSATMIVMLQATIGGRGLARSRNRGVVPKNRSSTTTMSGRSVAMIRRRVSACAAGALGQHVLDPGEVEVRAGIERQEAGAGGLDGVPEIRGRGDHRLVAAAQDHAGDGEQGVEVAGDRGGGEQDFHAVPAAVTERAMTGPRAAPA
jgi:hypothetical protein